MPMRIAAVGLGLLAALLGHAAAQCPDGGPSVTVSILSVNTDWHDQTGVDVADIVVQIRGAGDNIDRRTAGGTRNPGQSFGAGGVIDLGCARYGVTAQAIDNNDAVGLGHPNTPMCPAQPLAIAGSATDVLAVMRCSQPATLIQGGGERYVDYSYSVALDWGPPTTSAPIAGAAPTMAPVPATCTAHAHCLSPPRQMPRYCDQGGVCTTCFFNIDGERATCFSEIGDADFGPVGGSCPAVCDPWAPAPTTVSPTASEPPTPAPTSSPDTSEPTGVEATGSPSSAPATDPPTTAGPTTSMPTLAPSPSPAIDCTRLSNHNDPDCQGGSSSNDASTVNPTPGVRPSSATGTPTEAPPQSSSDSDGSGESAGLHVAMIVVGGVLIVLVVGLVVVALCKRASHQPTRPAATPASGVNESSGQLRGIQTVDNPTFSSSDASSDGGGGSRVRMSGSGGAPVRPVDPQLHAGADTHDAQERQHPVYAEPRAEPPGSATGACKYTSRDGLNCNRAADRHRHYCRSHSCSSPGCGQPKRSHLEVCVGCTGKDRGQYVAGHQPTASPGDYEVPAGLEGGRSGSAGDDSVGRHSAPGSEQPDASHEVVNHADMETVA